MKVKIPDKPVGLYLHQSTSYGCRSGIRFPNQGQSGEKVIGFFQPDRFCDKRRNLVDKKVLSLPGTTDTADTGDREEGGGEYEVSFAFGGAQGKRKKRGLFAFQQDRTKRMKGS